MPPLTPSSPPTRKHLRPCERRQRGDNPSSPTGANQPAATSTTAFRAHRRRLGRRTLRRLAREPQPHQRHLLAATHRAHLRHHHRRHLARIRPIIISACIAQRRIQRRQSHPPLQPRAPPTAKSLAQMDADGDIPPRALAARPIPRPPHPKSTPTPPHRHLHRRRPAHHRQLPRRQPGSRPASSRTPASTTATVTSSRPSTTWPTNSNSASAPGRIRQAEHSARPPSPPPKPPTSCAPPRRLPPANDARRYRIQRRAPAPSPPPAASGAPAHTLANHLFHLRPCWQRHPPLADELEQSQPAQPSTTAT